MEQDKKIKRPSQQLNLLHLTGLAFRMGATIAAGTLAGRWIDTRLALTRPIFTLILCLFAIGLAIYIVYREASQPKQ